MLLVVHKLAFLSMDIHYSVFCTCAQIMEKHKLLFSIVYRYLTQSTWHTHGPWKCINWHFKGETCSTQPLYMHIDLVCAQTGVYKQEDELHSLRYRHSDDCVLNGVS